VVNLGMIQKFVDAGKLDAGSEITEDALVASGVVRRKLDGVRVLAKGDVTPKLTLSVTGASKVGRCGGRKGRRKSLKTALRLRRNNPLGRHCCGRDVAAYITRISQAPPGPEIDLGGARLNRGPHGICSGTNGREHELGDASARRRNCVSASSSRSAF
jgi:hypothetical protein